MSIVRDVPARTREAPAGIRLVRVALAGCGTVGNELVRLLRLRGDAIERAHGIRFELARVLVRDPARARPEPVASHLITSDLDAFLDDAADADVVVEAIGGLEPAARIAGVALEHGRVFVTANKALVAEKGGQLQESARRGGGSLLYEAAVAGGVPVIRMLRGPLTQTEIRGVRGILNGTSNYLLTRMTAGQRFEAALSEARARGFAEADPSRDLDGRDAADKIRILAWLAFGVDPADVRVRRRGLLPRPDRLVADAAAVGGVVRLLAECTGRAGADDQVEATVEPVILPPDSHAARTEGADNLVAVDTAHSGVIRISGPGAGGAATASAVLADMIHGGTAGDPPVFSHAGTGALPPTHTGLPRWVLSLEARLGTAALPAILREEGVEVARSIVDTGGQLLRVLTTPCESDRVLAVEQRLEEQRLAPLVTRVETSPEWTGGSL